MLVLNFNYHFVCNICCIISVDHKFKEVCNYREYGIQFTCIKKIKNRVKQY